MTFERGIWAEAIQLTIWALPFAGMALAGEFAIQFAAQAYNLSQVSNVIASSLVWAYFAYAIHAQVLLNAGVRLPPGSARMPGFALRVVGISALSFFSGFILAVLMTRKLGIDPRAAYWLFSSSPDLMVQAVHATRGFAMLFVWTLLGTALPAYVAGSDSRMFSAARRGVAQFEWIAARLALGPGLLTVAWFMLYWPLHQALGSNGNFWSANGHLQIGTVAAWLLLYAVKPVSVALTAVILSRAFLRAEGMPQAA